jgi:hypothetical protein
VRGNLAESETVPSQVAPANPPGAAIELVDLDSRPASAEFILARATDRFGLRDVSVLTTERPLVTSARIIHPR